MTSPAASAERLQWAVDRLMECRSTTRTVADLAQWAGISRRQAQRIVGKAHQRLVEDLEAAGVDRRQLRAQLVHGLMEGIAMALKQQHVGGLVGAARELRELLDLGLER